MKGGKDQHTGKPCITKHNCYELRHPESSIKGRNLGRASTQQACENCPPHLDVSNTTLAAKVETLNQ